MLNFTQQLEAPLSQKQKNFSEIFLSFLKCALNLDHLKKNMSILAYLYPKLIPKGWLLKRLKGLASEHHSVVNVLPGSKHC